VAAVLRILPRYLQPGISLRRAVEEILREVYDKNLDVLSPSRDRPAGDLALPRKEEICAAINRLRTLRVRTVQAKDSHGYTVS
jgi:hypothetical protein